MTIKQRQIALVYRLIEKIWGSGVLMAFADLIEKEEER